MAAPLILLTPIPSITGVFEESSSELTRDGEGVAFGGDSESEDVLRLFEFVLPLGPVVSNYPVRKVAAMAYSSDSSRVLFPRDPVSLLSSMALLSISSSS